MLTRRMSTRVTRQHIACGVGGHQFGGQGKGKLTVTSGTLSSRTPTLVWRWDDKEKKFGFYPPRVTR